MDENDDEAMREFIKRYEDAFPLDIEEIKRMQEQWDSDIAFIKPLIEKCRGKNEFAVLRASAVVDHEKGMFDYDTLVHILDALNDREMQVKNNAFESEFNFPEVEGEEEWWNE